MQRVRKGDVVEVISGKDKTKRGEVLRVIPEEARVVVKGVNVVKRHAAPTPRNPEGGILEFEAPLHLSKVMPIDPESDKPTRVRHSIEDGKKVRVGVKSGKSLG